MEYGIAVATLRVRLFTCKRVAGFPAAERGLVRCVLLVLLEGVAAEMPDVVTLHIGGVFASERPTVLRTTVGSCIAVCVFDPRMRIGGMNHFLLPDASGVITEPATYGAHAMPLLLAAVERAGGDRARLVASVFGGGHVLDARESAASVPSRNIAFVHRFLSTAGLRVQSFEVGGYLPRRVTFETWSGLASFEFLSTPWRT